MASTKSSRTLTAPDEDAAADVTNASRDEALAMLDQAARYYLGMSADEFLRRWQTRDFDDPDSSLVLHVGMFGPAVQESAHS